MGWSIIINHDKYSEYFQFLVQLGVNHVAMIRVGDTGACWMTYPLKVKVTQCRANRLVVFYWVICSNGHVMARIWGWLTCERYRFKDSLIFRGMRGWSCWYVDFGSYKTRLNDKTTHNKASTRLNGLEAFCDFLVWGVYHSTSSYNYNKNRSNMINPSLHGKLNGL